MTSSILTPIRRLLPILAIVFSLFLFPTQASAHVVQTDYQLIPDAISKVEVQTRLLMTASYNTGEMMKRARVLVYAPGEQSQPWAETQTDDQGTFLFNPDPSLKGNWTIKIGQGDHGDILTIPVTDRGIELQKVGQLNYDMPHNVASNWVLPGAVLSSSAATAFVLMRKR
jgi:nickel transport protein